MDAARAVAGETERKLSEQDQEAFDKTLAGYIGAQIFNAVSHVNLGALHSIRGDMEAARQIFPSNRA